MARGIADAAYPAAAETGRGFAKASLGMVKGSVSISLLPVAVSFVSGRPDRNKNCYGRPKIPSDRKNTHSAAFSTRHWIELLGFFFATQVDGEKTLAFFVPSRPCMCESHSRDGRQPLVHSRKA